jgi:hypothetical protein
MEPILELVLNAKQLPKQGRFSGRVTVRGGDRPLKLAMLEVRLLQVSVHFPEGLASTRVELASLLDTALVRKVDLPPAEWVRYDFRIALPPGTKASTHTASYKVQARAEIAGVQHLSEALDLTVVERKTGGDALTLEAILARWPALRGNAPEPLFEALDDFRAECYSEREYLLAAEPVLLRLLRHSESEVARRAFFAWSALMDGQLNEERVRRIEQVASSPGVPAELLQEFVLGAARFAGQGMLGFVQRLARHEKTWVRRTLADHLRADGPRHHQGKREVLLKLAEDPEAEVRAAAVAALWEFRGEAYVVHLVTRMMTEDEAAAIREQCVEFLVRARSQGTGQSSG